jgi:hypothetical protein
MTRTQKYNFKVSIDQFHQKVDSNFEDEKEIELIDVFEKEILNLQKTNKEKYTMIELGSNQSYYSLLFKHILGKDKTLNILVEPDPKHLKATISEFFNLNNCEGILYNKAIGESYKPNLENIKITECGSITLDQILIENNIDVLDVLHCDIDGAELSLIKTCSDTFKNKKIDTIFLLTHSYCHEICKEFFNNLEYDLIYENNMRSIGWDNLLVYKKRK